MRAGKMVDLTDAVVVIPSNQLHNYLGAQTSFFGVDFLRTVNRLNLVWAISAN